MLPASATILAASTGLLDRADRGHVEVAVGGHPELAREPQVLDADVGLGA